MLKEQNIDVNNVERADKLSKGIDRLAVGNVDAVLLDLGLPDSQGIDTFEKIQSDS